MMKKRLLTIITAAAVFFSAAAPGWNAKAAEAAKDGEGTTYYVSTLHGKDSNDGKSKRNPFYSLRKINQLTLQPGDKILLECGSVFKNGYLHLFGQSGSKEAPIIIDQYGTGADPVIDTNGQGVWFQNYGKALDNAWHKYQGYVSSSILLYDSEYIEINNLEIVNRPPEIETVYNATDAMDRTGVAAVAQDKGTIDHIYLKGLNIHDVIGNVYNKHMNNGGIYFTVYEPHDEEKTGISRYDDVLIEDCSVINTNRWGIAVGYTTKWDQFQGSAISDETAAEYGSTNVVIRNNYVKDPGGDSITLMYCDRPLVEYNVSDGAARQMHSGDYGPCGETQRFAAGIWPWKCKDDIFQYNEAFDTKNVNNENGDGQGWDADWADGTVYQYNYSHNNEGGCLMVCLGEAYRTTFRYNISQNDLRSVLDTFSNPDLHAYNNVFYVKEGVPIFRDRSGGYLKAENNIFYYSGSEPKEENWTVGGNTKTYSNNLYYNYKNTPEDAAGVVVAKGETVFVNPGSAPAETTGFAHRHNDPNVRSVFDGYKLAENSPAIGRGKVITDANGKDMCELDFFGNEISPTETPDIGAHKYQEQEETLIPPAPQKAELVGAEATSATIAWPAPEASVGIKGYKIFHGDQIVKEVTDIDAAIHPETKKVTVTLTGLKMETEYSLSIVAYDEAGTASSPTEITFTTAKDPEYGVVEAELKKAASAAESKIKEGQKNYTKESWDALLAAYDKLSKLDENASKEEMKALVEQVNTAIRSLTENKTQAQKKPEQLAAPAITQVKSVLKNDGIKIQVSWNAVPNASSYTVYRTVGGKTETVGTTGSTVYVDSKLFGGKEAVYSAAAVSADKTKFTDSQAGTSKSIKIAKAPGKFKVKLKSKKASVSWGKVKKAKSYVIFRSEKKNGVYKKIGTAKKNKTSYLDKKVKKKKTYYYKVAAKDKTGYTAMTAAKKVKIK